MFKRCIACAVVVSLASAQGHAAIRFGETGGGSGETFRLPVVELITQDTANSVFITRERGNGGGNGGGGNTGGGGGGGGGGAPAPRTPLFFGSSTNFEAEVLNSLGTARDSLTIDIIPWRDETGETFDYEGEFEALSFDTGAGFDIANTGEEGEAAEVDFDYRFLRGGTRVEIDFGEGESFDHNEAMDFLFTINNDSQRELPMGLRFTVPTPGAAALFGLAGLCLVGRRNR